jgi:hypothetical protein
MGVWGWGEGLSLGLKVGLGERLLNEGSPVSRPRLVKKESDWNLGIHIEGQLNK